MIDNDRLLAYVESHFPHDHDLYTLLQNLDLLMDRAKAGYGGLSIKESDIPYFYCQILDNVHGITWNEILFAMGVPTYYVDDIIEDIVVDIMIPQLSDPVEADAEYDTYYVDYLAAESTHLFESEYSEHFGHDDRAAWIMENAEDIVSELRYRGYDACYDDTEIPLHAHFHIWFKNEEEK